MRKGIIDRHDASECSLVFIRDIQDIKDYVSDNTKLISHFIEMQDNGQVDHKREDHINNFKRELLEKCKNSNIGVFENQVM